MSKTLTYTKLTYWLGVTRKDGLCWRRAATENGVDYKKGDKFDGGYLLGRRHNPQRLAFFCRFERWPNEGELPPEIFSTEEKQKAAKQRPTHERVVAFLVYRRGNLYWRDTGKIFGWPVSSGYRKGYFFGYRDTVHRFIFFYHYRRWPLVTDHINRVKTDDRIENLRECTKSQNSMNIIRKPNSTGYRGVQRSYRGFRSLIRVDGRKIHLGTFPTAEAAATAYNEAAVIHHGEFAILNEVKG